MTIGLGGTRPYEQYLKPTPLPAIVRAPAVAKVISELKAVPPGYVLGPSGYEQLVPSAPGAVAAAGAGDLPPGTDVEEAGFLGGLWGVISPWLMPILAGGLGLAAGIIFEDGENGEPGSDPGTALVPTNGGAVVPSQLMGGNWQAFADFGGFGKGSPQAEGWIHPNRTTDGTGAISAETFRAWDPIQQRYYQLHGTNPYSNISLSPGRVLPGIGGFITKTWVTHAWRKDGSLASTQMAMTSTGRMISLSETGVMKNWRPYKSIVIGKSLTTRNLRRVSTRVKSHAKSMKAILKIMK
ncbi:unnamed protein product [marine sediment metagenome]|uniref:Uncharacterized protein n=1 Tax=marine sediment metagenome TaxID=412755 RepID=X1RXL5_9ZZZZ